MLTPSAPPWPPSAAPVAACYSPMKRPQPDGPSSQLPSHHPCAIPVTVDERARVPPISWHSAQSSRHRSQPCLISAFAWTLRLLVYHIGNAALSCLGFLTVVVGLVASILLLPLCCFGLVVLQVVLRLTYFCCRADVFLFNLLSESSQDHIVVPDGDALSAHEEFPLIGNHRWPADGRRWRMERSLAVMSPRSLFATIYFGTLKLACGLVSLVSAGLMILAIQGCVEHVVCFVSFERTGGGFGKSSDCYDLGDAVINFV